MLFAQVHNKEKRKEKNLPELLPTRCRQCMTGALVSIPKLKRQDHDKVAAGTGAGEEANTLHGNSKKDCSGNNTTQIPTGARDQPIIAHISPNAGLLPPGWVRRLSKTKNIDYYFNPATGDSTFSFEQMLQSAQQSGGI